MPQSARVTVCIPHVSRLNLLKKCLTSVVENVSLPHRILIVHDGKAPLPFALRNERMQLVCTGVDRTGLGFKRKMFVKLVETEYLFALDNDVLVMPNSLEHQVAALDDTPNLAAVSGLCFDKNKMPLFPGVGDYRLVGNLLFRSKYSIFRILGSKGDLFYADYIPIGYTTFRLSAFEDLVFDPQFDIAEHGDVFLQLFHTRWDCAIHKKSFFNHLRSESPEDYRKFRTDFKLLQENKRRFIEKWGVTPMVSRQKSLLGRAFYRMLVLLTYLQSPLALKHRLLKRSKHL